MAEVVLTIGEQIERSLDGRKQKWVVQRMNEDLPDTDKLSEVQFSNCKNGNTSFSEAQLNVLAKILNAEFTI